MNVRTRMVVVWCVVVVGIAVALLATGHVAPAVGVLVAGLMLPVVLHYRAREMWPPGSARGLRR